MNKVDGGFSCFTATLQAEQRRGSEAPLSTEPARGQTRKNRLLLSIGCICIIMDYQGNNLRDFLENNGHVVLQRVNNYNLRSFTEKEIEHITNGYSNLLGKGAFGKVYKGALDGQCLVAVKKYKDGMRKEEFAKEVIVHCQINHKNVVRLLGCCTEENTLMIVMEFVCNGNLSNILHCSNANGHVPFPLDKRLDIAIELAEVLSCMHSMYSPVLHGDIKPANILLDENLVPKLSDFGIARLLSTNETQQTRNIVGSIGYLDPLFIQTGLLTPKSDVYSFGVVLVEMITRKKVADGNVNLIQNFTKSLKRGKAVRKMFDEEIVYGKKKIKVLEDIAKLAVDCLRLEDILRPEMVEVADKLRKCRKDLELRRMGEKTGPSILLRSPGKNGAIGTRPGQVLSWAQRVKIALSAAQGIEFLHHKTESCIIHSDIKSSNILLFDNDVAKIGDLRVSKNQPGYLDDILLDCVLPSNNGYQYHAPECRETGEFSREDDMYSFGVVLLELITGRISGYSQNRLMIGAMPVLSGDEVQVQQYVDPRLRGKYPPKAAAKQMAAIASRCMQRKADSRPSMSIVVTDLRSLLLPESTPSKLWHW
ncbi:putative wall-associated receptor kinase-like 16 isoform X4 [Setaria italica]|uniref:putative wall-associated receptor kinase-like 16 isoform X4 n=1 Tax=Setaria italica TaxID=4555 RepID=UPI000BE4F8DD|nr:putative wall-associated receptor kinase-like 16 isoform X4 [Setaria italica]